MVENRFRKEDLVERLKEELNELRTKYQSGRFIFDKKKVCYDDDHGSSLSVVSAPLTPLRAAVPCACSHRLGGSTSCLSRQPHPVIKN